MRKIALCLSLILLLCGCSDKMTFMTKDQIAEKYYQPPEPVVFDTMEELSLNHVTYRLPLTVINGQYGVSTYLEKFAASRFLSEEDRHELEAREGIRYVYGETDNGIYYWCPRTSSSLSITTLPNDVNISLDLSDLDKFAKLISEVPFSEHTYTPTSTELVCSDQDSVTLKIMSSDTYYYARIFVTIDEVVIVAYSGTESDIYWSQFHETVDTLSVISKLEQS